MNGYEFYFYLLRESNRWKQSWLYRDQRIIWNMNMTRAGLKRAVVAADGAGAVARLTLTLPRSASGLIPASLGSLQSVLVPVSLSWPRSPATASPGLWAAGLSCSPGQPSLRMMKVVTATLRLHRDLEMRERIKNNYHHEEQLGCHYYELSITLIPLASSLNHILGRLQVICWHSLYLIIFTHTYIIHKSCLRL